MIVPMPQGGWNSPSDVRWKKNFRNLLITGTDGYKAVAYGKFTVVLLEAIKVQQREISGLKQEMSRIKKGL